MRILIQDFRSALRILLKKPGFTLVVMITLSLGIGANTAIFSLMDKLLLRSLPVKEPRELVLLSAESVNPRFLNNIFSYPDYLDYRDQNQVLSGLIAFIPVDGRLGTNDWAEKVSLELVSGNYFNVLGVSSARGRTFLPTEDQTPGMNPVAVLSYGFWRRRFGADPNVVGTTVMINDVPLTVIGIAPQGFTGPMLERPTDVWAPLMMRPQLRPSSLPLDDRNNMWLKLMGRLKPGVTMSQAQAGLDLLARQVREAHTPSANRNLPFFEKRMLLEPGGKGVSFLRGELNKTLTLLMAVVGLLLLIACANVSNLLVARSAARRKEIAMRLALGANRSRLMRQLLTESLLLALLGAGAGLIFAPWLHDLLLSFQPGIDLTATALSRSLDLRVVSFTVAVSVFSGLICGLVPALQSSRLDLVTALKDSNPLTSRRRRLLSTRQALVIAQVAIAFVILVGAGLFIKSLRNLFAIDPGFRTENVLKVPMNLPRQKYAGEKSDQFYRQLTERLKALPGVEAVSAASITPLSDSVGSINIQIEGYQARPGENLGIDFSQVGPGYHELADIPIVQGRGFTDQDRQGAPGVVIINETMARHYFPNQNPIGKRISRGPGNPWLEIIGVARDIKYHQLTERPIPHLDLPGLQNLYGIYANILMRTAGDPVSVLPAVRREVKAIDPSVPVLNASTLSEDLRSSIAPARMAMTLTSLFGLTALLLAVIGLYGVISYAVGRRTFEIGIRMALGAERRHVLRLVLREGLGMVAIGMILGFGGACAATRAIVNQLHEVSATDPLTFGLIALLLTAVALLACYIPARRATKVDPLVALRHESL